MESSSTSSVLAFVLACATFTLAIAITAALFTRDWSRIGNKKNKKGNNLASHQCNSHQPIIFFNGEIEWRFYPTREISDKLPHSQSTELSSDVCNCFSSSSGYWFVRSGSIFVTWMRLGEKGLTSNILNTLKQQFPSEFSTSSASVQLLSFLNQQLLSMEGATHHTIHATFAKLFSSNSLLDAVPHQCEKFMSDYFNQFPKNNSSSNFHSINISTLTHSLPSQLFVSLFNLPVSDISHLQQWSEDIENIFSISTFSNEERELICKTAVNSMKLCEEWVEKIIKEFISSSTDSPLFSSLLYLAQTGIIPRSSIASHFLFLFTASTKTTSHLLTNSLAQLLNENLLESPLTILQEIITEGDDEALTASIDELIRVTPSIHSIYRVITSPAQLILSLDSINNMNDNNDFASVVKEGQSIQFSLLEIQRSPLSFLHSPPSSTVNTIITASTTPLPLLLLSPHRTNSKLMTRQRSFGIGSHSCIGKFFAYSIIKSFYQLLWKRIVNIKLEKSESDRVPRESIRAENSSLIWEKDSVYLSLKELKVQIELKS